MRMIQENAKPRNVEIQQDHTSKRHLFFQSEFLKASEIILFEDTKPLRSQNAKLCSVMSVRLWTFKDVGP